MKARAFWVEAPGQGALRDEALPEPGPGEVLVRMLYSGISRGTESLVFHDLVPESLHESMRCPHQAGAFSLPVKYGYIAVGEIAAGDGEVGQAVFCLHPHQSHFVVPATAIMSLPSELPPARAVLTANLETAVNGVWDGEVAPEQQISVIGAGVVGLLTAWVLKQTGIRDLEVIDLDPGRADVAASLGLSFATPDQARSDRDVIFHASGSAGGLRRALALCANEARIIDLSWYGDTEVTLPLGAAFHARRLTIQSSQVGQIARSHRGQWDYRRRMAHVLELLAQHPELDVLVDEESSFDDLPQTMKRLAASSGGVLCHRVRY